MIFSYFLFIYVRLILKDDIIERINANLPPTIRVYGWTKVTKNFIPKNKVDGRIYSYILPAWLFATPSETENEKEGKSQPELPHDKDALLKYFEEKCDKMKKYDGYLHSNNYERVGRKISNILLCSQFQNQSKSIFKNI